MQAGFIGLGTMGASMAANLQKGLKARGDTLVVHDIRREAAARHVKDGAIWVDLPQAVAEQSEVIFTSLPGPPEFEAVAAGLLAGIKKGTAYFDLTTNSPTVVRKAHDAFAAKGVHLFDAPVSGGPRGAASGKLAIWCGGDADVFEKWKPVLDMIGDAAQYIGPIGAGSVAKLVHNCFGYIATAASAEVFSMGVKAGIEPLAIWEAVRKGAIGRRGAFDSLTDQFLSNQVRATGIRVAAGAQGCVAGNGARAGTERADAAGQSRVGRSGRGAEPRLERSGLAVDDVAATRARRREDRCRSAAADRGVGEQGEEWLTELAVSLGDATNGLESGHLARPLEPLVAPCAACDHIAQHRHRVPHIDKPHIQRGQTEPQHVGCPEITDHTTIDQ